jgi:pimeloyl-ACP methyl ester carboxylesterase
MPMKKMVTGPTGDIAVYVEGSGPVILCVHGWPENAWSWRHQMAYFSARGYTVASMDVRGYGESAKPKEIAAYSLKSLAADVAAVADALSDEPVTLFGHDWGAPITYTTALCYPEKIRALAGMSVPYTPGGEVSMLDLMRMVYAGRFFYILYFQAEGVVEAEFSQDPMAALRKIYYAISGDAPDGAFGQDKPEDAKLLDGLIDPDPAPAWLSNDDLAYTVAGFEKGGYHGAFNRYRALQIDHQELAEFRGQHLTLPTCFIGGERDPVRRFVPGVDAFANAGMACDDFRGVTIVPGVGHWVQQEAPAQTNAALETFLNGL